MIGKLFGRFSGKYLARGANMLLSELAQIVGGRLEGADVAFDGLSTDSRALQPGALFVALSGERFDGHDFVAAVHAQGAVAAMVERRVAVDFPQLVVDGTRLALGRYGAWQRALYAPEVVGITGSNGKTTVKEMITAILAQVAPVHKTQGNLNNDLGVPLTLLQLKPEHVYAVIEMGANHSGEIAYTSALACPDVAVITNAGAAHLEGFGGRDQVAAAKAELLSALSETGTAILNADDDYFNLWRSLATQRKTIIYGFSADADVRGLTESLRVSVDHQGFRTHCEYRYREYRRHLTLRLAGRHNVMNALAAIAACLALGVSLDLMEQALAQLQPVHGRMEPVLAFNDALLIDDTYNANPSSLAAALDVMAELPGERWVALGTFAELGEHSDVLHAELGHTLRQKGVTRLIASGGHCESTVDAFGEGAVYCQSQDDLIAVLKQSLTSHGVLLVKGSRSQKMERVVEALRNQTGRKIACC
jgi:UDP-N-acetylmuramoyl-tripeptide--D-alanyl-D-alanine ligase